MIIRKNVLWKVPAYCVIMGWIEFQLVVRFFGRFALVTLPDGTITSDGTRWLIMSGIMFFVTIIIGGMVFFSKMTKKEIFYSATIMVVFNVIGGLISYKTQLGGFSFFYAEISEWNSFINQLLYQMNLNRWISSIIIWALPYVFIPFGKKVIEDNVQI